MWYRVVWSRLRHRPDGTLQASRKYVTTTKIKSVGYSIQETVFPKQNQNTSPVYHKNNLLYISSF
jgi:hypothetical protein